MYVRRAGMDPEFMEGSKGLYRTWIGGGYGGVGGLNSPSLVVVMVV